MTWRDGRSIGSAIMLAMLVSAATTASGAAQGSPCVGHSVARLIDALRAYRAATTAGDLQERLRLQRSLAEAADIATTVLRTDASPEAEGARRAIAAIRLGLEGDPSQLAFAEATLAAVVDGQPVPDGDSLPLVPDLDANSLLDRMAAEATALREAVAAGDASQALTAQGELLNDAWLIELMFRYVPTERAQHVRWAIDNLRAGPPGDASRLEATAWVFDRLAHSGAGAH